MKAIPLGLVFLSGLGALAQEPLSLADAVEMAIEKHPSMEASAARVDAAESRITQAHSGYLPKVNLQESFARSNNPVFVFSSLLTQGQFTEQNFEVHKLNRPGFLNNFQTLVSVDQTVYDAGQTKNRKQTASIGKDMAEEQKRGTRMQLIAGVVRTYHGVALAAETLNVAAEAVKSAEADLKRAQAVREAGMATDADVLSIRVHLAAMKEQQISRQYHHQVSLSALNEALGLPLDSRHDLTTALTELPEMDIELAGYEERAVADRPEARQAELAAQMAETGSKAARAAYWPQVSLRGAFEADRQQFVRKGGANWFVGATMRWNLFNGNADKARIEEAVHSLRSAAAEKKRADRGVRLEVRKANADLQAAKERIIVASAAVTHAEESLRITKNRYEAGLNTVTDLLRNETALLESKTRRLAAIYDQRVAAAMLQLAAGSLSVDNEVLR